MSNAAIKTCGLGRRVYAIAIAVSLCGCTGSNLGSSPTWKTYTNGRYGLEFPYPSNCTALPPPDNNDGQAFVSPQNPEVEIRGWAGNRLPEWEMKQKNAKTSMNPNFKTAQGVSGQLAVEVGAEVSSMTLTLTQGQVRYYWQGRSPSQQFDDYYRFFYYIAEQYRIPSQERSRRRSASGQELIVNSGQ